MATTTRRTDPTRWMTSLAALLAMGVAACSSGSSAPKLQSVAVGPSAAFVAVGSPQQFTANGTYADGSTAALTTGLTWTSSDAAVATVDSTGLVTPKTAGTVTIKAVETASGLSGTGALTARTVTAVTALPAALKLGDRGTALYRVSGLTAGALYRASLDNLSDDVDLAVYSDLSLDATKRTCSSANVDTNAESCVVAASAAGDVLVQVDGKYTEAGADFRLSLPAPAPEPVDGTIASPGGLPYTATIGVAEKFFKVTGLTPGSAYEVRISGLTADIDVEVYADGYMYKSLCASYKPDLVDDFCTAMASSAGELYVEIDGESSGNGGKYTLTVK